MINSDAIRDEFGYSVVCGKCRKTFESKRASAVFCGASCRAKHHRAKAKRKREIEQAISALRLVVQNMPMIGQSEEYLALQKMQTIIVRGLSNVEER